ncbi:MAG: valine--tRNA ligase [candidate division WOR-3 bacterium]|nr:MAG: valine--tRNA ligase [candidate division WOR-3 bacterium]
MNDFPSKYDPSGTEERIYKFWLEKEYFTPDPKSKKPPYTIMIPLPNVTGPLTMGHVLNNSFQDILIRYKKLNGYNTLWLVGMDHAGIATQVKVEENLRTEGIKKQDMGRDKFVAEVWKWKEEIATVIRNQLRRLGYALDWSREQFTLSDQYSEKVTRVFVMLYNKGMIYRGEYIINWCPRCLTALSDEQVATEENPGKLYYIRYPIIGSEDHITVATTRPETMLGDTAVCVNPNDKRYRHFVGRRALLPIMEREIPIIADDYVDPEFGTGALKVTPAHDPFDFELARKHQLELIDIMNPDATLNALARHFNGLDRYEARQKIVEQLEAAGLVEKIENYELPLSKCERCETAIEPRISKQWFVKMKPLAQPALLAVHQGKVRIFPKRWVNLYNHWMENVRDWCISRQLWWGHRIPVYYCNACYDPDKTDSEQGIMVAETKPTQCSSCGSGDIYQDQDVLDTWFSSWIWPFATLGWPLDTEDYRRFYPTQALVTGWDIIYLWVARMIMAGIEFTQRTPFGDVALHVMIRDAKGRKMSKSLGNSPEPVELIDKFGADALRFGLLLITPREQDVLFSEKSIEVGRKFCNKLWNAARLIYSTPGKESEYTPENSSIYDAWIADSFNKLLIKINGHFATFEVNAIARELYDYVWHTFCDWYLEFLKIVPSQATARFMMKRIIIVLHPFMPFITEEIYRKFGFAMESIMLEDWPEPVDVKKDTSRVAVLVGLIEEIRNIRGIFNIKGKERLQITVNALPEVSAFLKDNESILRKFAGIDGIDYDRAAKESAASIILPGIECYVKLTGIDMEREKGRLLQEIDFLTQRIDEIKNRLNNPKYMSKASNDVKEMEKQRLEDFLEKKEGIQRAMKRL